MKLAWLGDAPGETWFPDPEGALAEPDGLLAAGGALSVRRILAAYRLGIFPWYEVGQPVLWWCPDPRAVLFPRELRVSRSLAKSVRNRGYEVSLDQDFTAVIAACGQRPETPGTWITPEMAAAYTRLHRGGHAHSVEVWEGQVLAGGLYGVAMGRVFFGESMFSRGRDASKVGLVHLVAVLAEAGYELVDCQLQTRHLQRLGSRMIPRREFLTRLARLVAEPAPGRPWPATRAPAMLPGWLARGR